MRSSAATERIIWSIAGALLCWGIYLAIGATGMFVQESMMDVRKSAIVAVCVLLFLALWGTTLIRKPSADADQRRGPAWSKAGIVSAGMSIVGGVIWIVSVGSWQSVDRVTTTMLGWLAALCMIGAATFGMISLSDRFIRRGKWLGAAGLILSLGALIVFVLRMSP